MFSLYLSLFWSSCLYSHRRLHVVVLQEALQVEDGHLLSLTYVQKLTQSSVRQDVLLVVQAVLLHVVHYATGYIRAAHLSALGLAQEDAQGISNLLGLGEYTGLLGYRVASLVEQRCPRAAPATSLLNLACQALLQLLHVSQNSAQSVAELIYLGYLAVKLGYKVQLSLRLSSSGGYCGGSHYRGSYYGSSYCRSGSLAATRGGGSGGYSGCGLSLCGSSLRSLGNSRLS